MGPPPSYADLGKASRDLFNKGYNFGFLKIDTTTKVSEKNVEFKTGASHNQNSGKMFGSLEAKYKLNDQGVTLTERWNTDNTLGTEVQIVDKMAKGSKITLDTVFTPQLGKRSGKVKLEYGTDQLKMNTDVQLDAGPQIVSSGVFRYTDFLVGAQVGFNAQSQKMTSNNIAVAMNVGPSQVHTYVNDMKEFGATFYHKVNSRMELAANAGWVQGDQSTKFGLACLYKAAEDWTVRAKISSTSQLAIATAHQLHPHLKFTASALFNLHNFNEGGHKFGAGFEYEPCC